MSLPIEIEGAGQLLGMPVEDFLRDYWQQRPLLIRQAFEGFQSPLSGDDLAALSLQEEALSRLVLHDRARRRWTLESGPFDDDRFDDLPERDWSLLVQDVASTLDGAATASTSATARLDQAMREREARAGGAQPRPSGSQRSLPRFR